MIRALWNDRATGALIIGGTFAAYPIALAACALLRGIGG